MGKDQTKCHACNRPLKTPVTRWTVSVRFGEKGEYIKGALPALVTETEDFDVATFAFERLINSRDSIREKFSPIFGPALTVLFVERVPKENAKTLHMIRIDEGLDLVDLISGQPYS